MIEVTPFAQLGRFENDWLTARYHFSFADYHDPARMGVGPLRVWNDDTVAPGEGFEMHGHRDMEIVTYVRQGAITHQDHLGNRGRTGAGDLQVMTAGKGILHSEYNLEAEPTRIFQIWIRPNQRRLKPRWAQRRFPRATREGALVPLASGRDGDRDALPIHQDAALLGASLLTGQSVTHRLDPGRRAYLVAASGQYDVNGVAVAARDGVTVAGEDAIAITARADGEVLLADLP